MKKITVLGSTGSIGQSTLSIVRQHPDKFKVWALVGGQNSQLMLQQCIEFEPAYVAMADSDSAKWLKLALSEHNINCQVFSGSQAICELAALEEVDQVMAAIVGAAGLLPTLAAIKQGKQILLANKESLVTCGGLFMQAVKQFGANLLPIDSEHNAIFQSLPQEIQQQLGLGILAEYGVSRIILTGSGGPFRDSPISSLAAVTPSQACAHPNWQMGRKISVDSATMMNKGLEYIEARWLFNASAEEMEIIIHPQSIIHSMVRYDDGSVLAQLGNPDMRTPIAHAMAYPQRITSGVNELDFMQLQGLTFRKPDFARYPCLKLAIDAYRVGQAATTALNAANEISVEYFLNHAIRFTDIAMVNDQVLQQLSLPEPQTVEDVLSIDQWARTVAKEIIKRNGN